MPDYSHLASPIADTRYVLAAHYLRGCRMLVEVGGHRLHSFLGGDIFRQVWNIDPTVEQGQYTHGVMNVALSVKDFDFEVVDKCHVPTGQGKKGICLLGMEMYDNVPGLGSGVESVENIGNNLSRFDIAVIEFVGSNPVAHAQSLMLYGAAGYGAGMTRTVHFTTQWSHDHKYPEPNESFQKVRDFWVLEKL